MLNTIKGMLIEYALSIPPLVLVFDFNPQSLTRSRTITLRTGSAPGTRGGYDFALPTETARVAQGVTVQPWRADVCCGGVRGEDGALYLTLVADQPWEGRVVFDRPRHKDYLHLPLDYPRINQFAEWFTAQEDGRYTVQFARKAPAEKRAGTDLLNGLALKLKAGEPACWRIQVQP